jgi:hypothetical protein
MQFGNEVGESTAIGSTRRRWLAVLVAFILGAAVLFVSAGQADATTPPSISFATDHCSVDVTVTQGSQTVYVVIVPIFRTDPLSLIDYQWGNGSAAPETFTFNGLQPGPYKATAVVTKPPYVLATSFDIDPNQCMPTFEGDDFTATLKCTGPCTAEQIFDGGPEFLDLRVNSNSPFTITAKYTVWGPPGKAYVDVSEAPAGKNGLLPACGKNGKSGTNCFHVNTVKVGGQKALQYDVFWDDNDPRLKFG